MSSNTKIIALAITCITLLIIIVTLTLFPQGNDDATSDAPSAFDNLRALGETWQLLDPPDADLGFTILYPPDWTTIYDPVMNEIEFTNNFALDPQPEQNVHFAITDLENVNPTELPLDSWFEEYFLPAFSEEYDDAEFLSIDGREAIQFQVIEPETSVLLYVLNGTDVIQITYSTEHPDLVPTYEKMIQSFRFSSDDTN